MGILSFNPTYLQGGFGFAAPDQAADIPYLGRVGIIGFSGARNFPASDEMDLLFWLSMPNCSSKPTAKSTKTGNKFISNGNIAAGLVGYMNIMTLIVQTRRSSSHADVISSSGCGEKSNIFGMRALLSGCAGMMAWVCRQTSP